MNVWKWLVKFYGFCKRTREQYIKEFVYLTYDGWGPDKEDENVNYVFTIEHYPFSDLYYPVVEIHREYMRYASVGNKFKAKRIEKKDEKLYLSLRNGLVVTSQYGAYGGRSTCDPCRTKEIALRTIQAYKEYELMNGVKKEEVDRIVISP